MRFILLLIILLTTELSIAQVWGRNTESEFTNEAMDVEVDSQGNSYTAGYISGQTAFDINIVEQIPSGNNQIYICKYNSTGGLVWVKTFGGNFSDRAYDLAIDENDDVYVTGQYYGQVAFGSFTLNSVNSSRDIFIIKLNSSGTVIWARSEGGNLSDNAYGITTDNLNNVIVTGQFMGQATIAGVNYTSNVDPTTGLSSFDLFLSKYDSNGNPLWSIIGSGIYENRGLAVSVDSQNTIFITGQFSDTLLFGNLQVDNIGYNVGFVSRITPTGNVEWVNKIKAGVVMAYDLELNSFDEIIIVGDNIGNLYYTSNGISNSVSTNYSKNVFCLKLDNNGDYLWGKSLGSDNELSARSVSVSSTKEIYITGYFKCYWSELRENQTATFNSVGFKDAYLWKLNNLGNSSYVKQFGSKKNDQGQGVAILNGSTPMICGAYTENLNIVSSPSISYDYNQASNFDLLTGGFSATYHHYLSGDESLNSFLLNAINANTPVYNFFYLEPTDSLTGFISSEIGINYGCQYGDLIYNTLTYDDLGPSYLYLWNTGETTREINVLTAGDYFVEIERVDGCSSGLDSIIVYPLPTLPAMSDSFGLAINEPGEFYYNYELCYPDSVTTWFSNMNPSYSIEIIHNGSTLFNDTLPHNYAGPGIYDVYITDSVCSNWGEFTIEFDYAPPHDILPYIVLVDEEDYNDSITICTGNAVILNLLDSLENPNGVFYDLPSDPVVLEYWTISPGIGIAEVDTFVGEFYPTNSGWYTISHFASYGYDNLCGLDTSIITVTDSFYVEVQGVPSGTTMISGDLLCPNGSVYLTLSNVISGLSWSGPFNGINWISNGEDSIQATIEGNYSYQGTIIDSISGCSSHLEFNYFLQEKPKPAVLINPSDGIICPNDSVYLSTDSFYVSYEWNGPTGSNLSTTFDLWDDDQGFYYVIVEDTAGCFLTSELAEIREYVTPYLDIEPTNVLCENDELTITAIAQSSAIINWLPPIVSNSTSVIVNQPGWYYCEMTQCGITVIDSVEVLDGTFNVSLNITDSIVCFGDEVIISTDQGYSEYYWSSGEQGVAVIQVSEENNYSIEVVNQFGCSAFSDTVFLNYIEESSPPLVANQILCGGGDILINYSSITNWYYSDSSLITTGNSVQLQNILTDTIILVANDVVGCQNNYTSVLISVIDSLGEYQIMSDSVLCTNSALDLSVNNFIDSLEWSIDGMIIGMTQWVQIDAFDLMNSNMIQLVISNECYSDTLLTEIELLFPDSLIINEDSILLCPMDDLLVFTNQNYDSMLWTGYFGNSSSDSLFLSIPIYNGYIFAEGLGDNGCLTLTDSIYVEIIELDYSLYNNFVATCENDSVSFGIVTNIDSMLWTFPNGAVTDSTSIQLVVNDFSEGWYFVELFDTTGCQIKDSLLVEFNENPFFNFPSDTTICAGDFINITSTFDSITFEWIGYGSIDSLVLFNSQEIIISATSVDGCSIIDTFFVNVVDCDDQLPNVITANGDGINDYFVIDEAPLFPNNRLVIVNRWGNIVFEEFGYKNSFSGLDLNDGVYFYVFHKNYREKPEMKSEGYLTITR